jgi:hypothetical protein
MANWKGMGDTRPSVGRSKAGKIDCTGSPKKSKHIPRGSESFGDRVGQKKVAWKGNKDSRP